MPYNNGFALGYPYYQQPYQQPIQPSYPAQAGGIVRVKNENEARTYFVAPGNSVTFVNDDATYLFSKTVNMGQLDKPIFEKYRLVREDDAQAAEAPQKPSEAPVMDLSQYAMKKEIEAYRAELDALKADIESFRNDLYGIAGKKPSRRKEAVQDDD